MTRSTPEMRDLTRRLVAYEANADESSGTPTPTAFRVCETLRQPLAALTGNAGFHSLLSRALALATPQAPWLASLHIQPDGSLGGVADIESRVAPDAITEGSVVLVAELLGLLVAFIGEILTLRMVQEVWPELPLQDSVLSQRIEK